MKARAAAWFLRLPLPVRLTVLHSLGRYAPWEQQFDFSPPTLEHGEVSGAPDFVGIGVQKAGTSWWYSMIVRHPGVYERPGIHKERHFLDRFGSASFSDSDVGRYHGWFPRMRGTLAGEWTPDYLWFPWLPELMRRVAPDARLLVVLRDPIERFRSGLAHQLRNGAKLTGSTMAEAVERGFYDRQLASWASYYDAGKLLVLQYEKCVAQASVEIARTYRYLGLDDGFTPTGLERQVNITKESTPLDRDVRDRLVEVYTQDVASLAKHYPEIDLSLWPNFGGA